MIVKMVLKLHTFIGHRQKFWADGPPIDGWQGFRVLCSCGKKFYIVR